MFPPVRGLAALPFFRLSSSTTIHPPKFPVLTLPRSLRLLLPAIVLAVSLAAAPRGASAQTNIDTSFAIGLDHASTEPYNFTGRIFDLDNVAFGSGTLIRRHTVLTAGHVVFDPSTGFIANATFSRGLYESYTFQKSQIIAVDAISGYRTTVVADGTNTTLAAFSRDMGYVLLMDPPRDGTWGVYVVDPSLLADSSNQFFVLGYPGVNFDGRTMAYIVPSTTFTQIGVADSGLFENDGYSPEPGESGGPVYVFNGERQQIIGETIGGIADSSGEFNATFIRAINKEANLFLSSAEYISGLITKIKIKGPKTVTHGTSVVYKTLPRFLVPDPGTTVPGTTTRYTEIRLRTSTPGTSTQPAVTIQKLSKTEFRVTFAATIRPKSTTTLTAYRSKTDPVPNSTITITVQ